MNPGPGLPQRWDWFCASQAGKWLWSWGVGWLVPGLVKGQARSVWRSVLVSSVQHPEFSVEASANGLGLSRGPWIPGRRVAPPAGISPGACAPSQQLCPCPRFPLQGIVLPSSLVLCEKWMNSARLADTICRHPSSSVPRPLMTGTSAGSISTTLTSATS